jgi:prepilin-type processing-associated H-X9-DG protein
MKQKFFTKVKRPANKVMMQDIYMGMTEINASYYNHGKGHHVLPYTPNPSCGYKIGTLFKDEYGANLLFYDGHLSWYRATKLEDVGETCLLEASTWRVYSLLNN